jgi:hypothetical protein
LRKYMCVNVYFLHNKYFSKDASMNEINNLLGLKYDKNHNFIRELMCNFAPFS